MNALLDPHHVIKSLPRYAKLSADLSGSSYGRLAVTTESGSEDRCEWSERLRSGVVVMYSEACTVATVTARRALVEASRTVL
jgi:hypothetical protein